MKTTIINGEVVPMFNIIKMVLLIIIMGKIPAKRNNLVK